MHLIWMIDYLIIYASWDPWNFFMIQTLFIHAQIFRTSFKSKSKTTSSCDIMRNTFPFNTKLTREPTHTLDLSLLFACACKQQWRKIRWPTYLLSPVTLLLKAKCIRPANSVLNTSPLLGVGSIFLLYCSDSSFPSIANEPFLKMETVRV